MNCPSWCCLIDAFIKSYHYLMYWLGFHGQRQCIWCLLGWWAMVSGYKFLMFHLHLWQASSVMVASVVASELLEVDSCFPSYSICDVCCDVILVSHWRLSFLGSNWCCFTFSCIWLVACSFWLSYSWVQGTMFGLILDFLLSCWNCSHVYVFLLIPCVVTHNSVKF